MRNRSLILWGLFIGIDILVCVDIARVFIFTPDVSLLNLTALGITGKLIIGLSALLLVLHSVWNQGFYRGLAFVTMSLVLSLGFEIAGIRYGIVFGGRYTYLREIYPVILQVPLIIPLFWAGFIYTGYVIGSSLIRWPWGGGVRVGLLRKLFAAACCSIPVVAIDLFLEPLMVDAGNWKWLDSGRYFGIPAGNFVGWFLVAFVSIVGFLVLGEYLPQKQAGLYRQDKLIPVLAYGLFCIVLLFYALRINYFSLAALGLAVMMPMVIVSLLLFRRDNAWRFSPEH